MGENKTRHYASKEIIIFSNLVILNLFTTYRNQFRSFKSYNNYLHFSHSHTFNKHITNKYNLIYSCKQSSNIDI